MRLDRLRVRGLRSFTKETEIDLRRLGEQGLFVITGPTGAGKSTILDGIFLALFGKSPRGEASECVSAGALELVVRLELTQGRGLDARSLAVERRFRWGKRKQDGARGAAKHPPLRIEVRDPTQGDRWAPVDLGGRKPDEYLAEQVMRVSMNDFQQAVVLPQGEFDALLRARPAERRTLVASLFRTEHLGQPLVDVLKGREASVREEMGRLEEAEREVAVSAPDAEAAARLAEATAVEARAAIDTLAVAEGRAATLRFARQRCAAREAADEALATLTAALLARAPDRERVARGRRAASAEGPVLELAAAEADFATSERHVKEADAAARVAEAGRKLAASALAAAIAARAAAHPRALEQLGRARLALSRGADLAELSAACEARAAEQAAAEDALARARSAFERARADTSAREAETAAIDTKLAETRVGEDERAIAVAILALVEVARAGERIAEVKAAELRAASARVAELAQALAAAEDDVRAATATADRFEAERRRLEVDAQRAAAEVDHAERDLTSARRAEAAADLALALAPGESCPVCGSRDHAGGAAHPGGVTLSIAERGLAATRRAARAADRDLAEAAREAASRAEDARAAEGRVERVHAQLVAARDTVERLDRGEVVPLAVTEARAAAERLEARADVALSALPIEQRDEARARAASEPYAAIEARIAALGQRARAAEELLRARARAAANMERARETVRARADAAEAAERARAVAEARAAAADALATQRRDEIAALLSELEPRGQRGLFDPPRRSAAEWVRDLEEQTRMLVAREDEARAALEEVRAEVDRAALEAREATVHRREASARHTRARAAAQAAFARAEFPDLDALRAALLDPATLEALEAELRRLEGDHARAAAIAAERRRDVDVEVSEDAAAEAEAARDAARRAAEDARERAAHASARGEEIARRRARAVEIRAKIDALAPRANRLARIRQVIAGGQLSELAAERHLEAVTRGAATLLQTLSSGRYALVRDDTGAFAVSDAAHGGLVRAPSTLSGGETFLVSLALALALSERIQLAGRTRFDFFFLDEGFGSLDAGTLEIALGALEQLRGPHRVIGMISHVPAIDERMPRRLRVGNERRGGAAAVTHEP